jgi:glutamyl-tRNA synthetase
MLYEAFGWEAPVFCHLPMVMGQDGKKLSKRHGATSIDEFRTKGYLPEALINYVALLGCSYEEGRDIFSLEELAGLFSLEKLNKAPAVFDYKKLEWYNGQYIRMKSSGELAELALPLALAQNLFDDGEEQRSRFAAAMPLVRERTNFLHEIPAKVAYLFSDPPVPPLEEFIPKKLDRAGALRLLRLGRELIRENPAMGGGAGDEEAEELVKAKALEEQVKLGDLLTPLRAALTGSRVSPPLFGSIRLLGTETCLRRIDRALAALDAAADEAPGRA